MQSQTKDEKFTVLEKNHQISLQENMKAAPDKSHVFLTRKKFLGDNYRKKHYRCNSKNPATFK